MWILSNPSSQIEVQTGSAGAVSVHASWVDSAQGNAVPQAGAITPTGQNTPSITTATTTTVVPSPGATVTTWSIAGSVLTLTSGITGTATPGAALSATGLFGLYILDQLTGTPGGAGTYQLSGTGSGTGTLTLTVARTVQKMTIVNTSATVANQITVLHNDGTNTATMFSASLSPGWFVMMTEQGGWLTYDNTGALRVAYSQSPPFTPLNFATGTTFTVPSWNSHVRVTSTAAGPKTITGPAATGSMGLIEVVDAGALAANPTGTISFASASSINGPYQLSVPTQSMSMRDAASGQIDSV